MKLDVDGVTVDVDGMNSGDLAQITQLLRNLLSEPPTKVKNRDAIAEAFIAGVRLCPSINPSDLWHHVVYRQYVNIVCEVRPVNDPKQSWVRASGDAFELFIARYYTDRLAIHGVQVSALLDKVSKLNAVNAMGIAGKVGSSKLDLSIERNGRLLGGIHSKVSLAERVSDDVPASRAMMRKGYLSALVTLDVKSFPVSSTVSAARAYQNRGELGSPTAPTDKRLYIEKHGEFDMCISFNTRTIPSLANTRSKKKIYTVELNKHEPDPLERAILAIG